MQTLPPPQRLPVQSIDLQTFKGFKFIMLDSFVCETREIYDEISGTFQWELFEQRHNDCANYIQDKCINKRVFLIASGSMGRQIVPHIHDLPQLYAVYIYCADVESNHAWAQQYRKIRIVCNDDDEYLLPLFAVDIAQANIEWADEYIRNGERDKARAKYMKALNNLTKYMRYRDIQMINDVQQKLELCK